MVDDSGRLLSPSATIEALRGELERTVTLARAIEPSTHIPTCPEWDAAALLTHLGTVHRWVTAMLERGSTTRVSIRELGIQAPDRGAMAPWIRSGADRLISELSSRGAGDPVWTWGADQEVGWWTRRQLHEAAVHNADLLLATGTTYTLAPRVAADGICELLDNTPSRLEWPDAAPPTDDGTVHLHATDTGGDTGDDPTTAEHDDSDLRLNGDDGEWMVAMADGTVTWDHGHGKGDTAVRAPVVELMLMMNQRRPIDAPEVEVFGDPVHLRSLLRAVSH